MLPDKSRETQGSLKSFVDRDFLKERTIRKKIRFWASHFHTLIAAILTISPAAHANPVPKIFEKIITKLQTGDVTFLDPDDPKLNKIALSKQKKIKKKPLKHLKKKIDDRPREPSPKSKRIIADHIISNNVQKFIFQESSGTKWLVTTKQISGRQFIKYQLIEE